MKFNEILALCIELDEGDDAASRLHKETEKTNKLNFMIKKEAERQRYERYKEYLRKKKEMDKQQKNNQKISKIENSL